MTVTNDQLGTTTGTGFLLQCGLGADLSIVSNAISVDNSVHRVTGSGSLTTINWAAANSPTNPAVVYLIRPSGSTWAFGSGGNITLDFVPTIADDVPITCVWDGTAWRLAWPPSSLTDITSFGGDLTAAYAAITTGELVLGPHDYTIIGPIVPKSGVTIRGAGRRATRILFNSAGRAIDYNDTTAFFGFQLIGLKIECGTTATGAIRIGNTDTSIHPFNETYFKNDNRFQDLWVVGPGPSTAGKIGVSFTQVGNSTFDSIEVSQWETGWIMDRTTANMLLHPRVSAVRYGMIWTAQDGPAGAGCQDAVMYPEILTGNVGSDGYCVKIDYADVRFTNPFYEWFATAGKCILWFTNKGSNFHESGALYALSSGTPTNTYVFDAGASRNYFEGARAGGAMPASTVGAPSALGINRHYFMLCDEYITGTLAAARATNPARVVAIGPGVFGGTPGSTTDSQFLLQLVGGVFDFVLSGSGAARWLAHTGDFMGSLDTGGNMVIAGTINASKAHFTTLLPFANNAAALAGGLTAGESYVVTGSDPRQIAIVF